MTKNYHKELPKPIWHIINVQKELPRKRGLIKVRKRKIQGTHWFAFDPNDQVIVNKFKEEVSEWYKKVKS